MSAVARTSRWRVRTSLWLVLASAPGQQQTHARTSNPLHRGVHGPVSRWTVVKTTSLRTGSAAGGEIAGCVPSQDAESTATRSAATIDNQAIGSFSSGTVNPYAVRRTASLGEWTDASHRGLGAIGAPY